MWTHPSSLLLCRVFTFPLSIIYFIVGLSHIKDDLQNEYKKYQQYKSPLPAKPLTGSLTRNASPGTVD